MSAGYLAETADVLRPAWLTPAAASVEVARTPEVDETASRLAAAEAQIQDLTRQIAGGVVSGRVPPRAPWWRIWGRLRSYDRMARDLLHANLTIETQARRLRDLDGAMASRTGELRKARLDALKAREAQRASAKEAARHEARVWELTLTLNLGRRSAASTTTSHEDQLAQSMPGWTPRPSSWTDAVLDEVPLLDEPPLAALEAAIGHFDRLQGAILAMQRTHPIRTRLEVSP